MPTELIYTIFSFCFLALHSRKVSHDSQPTPIPTVSEMSEAGLSPRSPLLEVLNVRDVSEVISEVMSELESENEDVDTDTKQDSGASHDLSDQIITKAEQQKSISNIDESIFQFQKQENKSSESEQKKVTKIKEKKANPFHFNTSKTRSFEQSNSEPKKVEVKNGGSLSNKKRNEILESKSSSLMENVEAKEIRKEIPTDIESSDSETLKEEVEEKKPRKKWQKEAQPIIKFKQQPVQQDSSLEGSCYYCRNVCERHQSLIMPECRQDTDKKNKTKNAETSDIAVQVGKSTIHHYLFDPTQDAIFDSTFQPSYQRTTGLSTEAAANSIIQLMKKQLELTEHHMRSQKELYRSYCKTLEKTQQAKSKRPENKEKVLFGRSERPKKLTFEEALKMVKDEMAQQEEDVHQISKSFISTQSSKKESKKSKTSRSGLSSKESEPKFVNTVTHKINKQTPKHKDSIVESIEEEINNTEYEMDFENESEVRTETNISTEESTNS